MKKKKIAVLAAVLLIVALIVTIGATLMNKNSNESDPANTKNPDETSQGGEPVATEAPPEPVEPTVGTTQSELSEAQAAFPDVTATTNHSKEEVQVALLSAYNYINRVSTDVTFISGDFVANNYPSDYFETNYRGFYTTNGYVPLFTAFETMKTSTDQEARVDAATTLSRVAPMVYVGDTGYHVSDECRTEQVGCLVDDKVGLSDFSWDEELETGRLIIETDSTIDINLYDPSETKGSVKYVTNWLLYMTPTDYDADIALSSGANTWGIDGVLIGGTRGAWVQE